MVSDVQPSEAAPMSTTPSTTTLVTKIPEASPETALTHFADLLSMETDCWDVHESMVAGPVDFALLDVRGKGGFDAGHVSGATHFPHLDMNEESLAGYPDDTLFVVYCAGPHCNGADKAAVRLSRLGRPVKKMIGGIEGWIDEGFELVSS